MNSLLLNTLDSKRGDTLEDIQDQLNKAENNKDYLAFYDYLKTTKFPFIPCNERNTQMVYNACFKTLHAIGEVSIPVAVALSMHYYVLASMASYPFSKTSKEYWKREMLLHQIKKEGLIIANTGSVRTYTNVSEHKGVTVQRKDGKYLVNGKTPFMSLAGVADYLVFTAELSQGKKAVFFVPSNSEGIYFQDSPFGQSMEGSFTKAVSFKNLEISNAHVLALDTAEETKCELLIYQRSWFQALVPAPYLGAARRVIADLNSFSRQKLKNGKKLAESESFLQGMGELQMKYKSAYHSCIHAGRAIAGFKKGDKVNLEHIFEASVLAKYFSTHFSEDIVTGARQLMGSQFLVPGSHTNKVYKEIVFGALQPMTDGDIKDFFGRMEMGDLHLSRFL